MTERKFLTLAIKYLDNDAMLFDVVSQEIAIIDFGAWLDRAVEQRDAADLPTIELLRRVRENFTEMESYNPKLAAEIDAVLKTAGGG
jgi:hypothetical protein